MRAAERLFAEKGLGTVSVKDITRAAGARNPSAVHYHFGNVESLIKEVFAQRYHAIEQARLARLTKLDVPDRKERLIALLEAASAPFFECCLEEEGRLYVRFVLQFASDPRFNLPEVVADLGIESLGILRAQMLGALEGIDPAVLAMRMRHGFNISLIQVGDYVRAVEDGTAPPLDHVIRESARSLAGYLTAPTD